MRTRPGSRFWAWVYSILFFCQSGWPGWAGASAGALFYLGHGRLPEAGDARTVYLLGVLAFVACVAILVFGGKRIERTLEVLNWVLVCTHLPHHQRALRPLRPRGALARGGSRLLRLRSRHGVVPLPARGGGLVPDRRLRRLLGRRGPRERRHLELVPRQGLRHGQRGGLHPLRGGRAQGQPRPHRLRLRGHRRRRMPRWRGWWKIVAADQWGIFFIGALLGMALPAILYTSALPPSTDVRGLGLAAALARALAERGGTRRFRDGGPHQRVDPLQDPARHPGGPGALGDRHPLERQRAGARLARRRRPGGLLRRARHRDGLGPHRPEPDPALHPAAARARTWPGWPWSCPPSTSCA